MPGGRESFRAKTPGPLALGRSSGVWSCLADIPGAVARVVPGATVHYREHVGHPVGVIHVERNVVIAGIAVDGGVAIPVALGIVGGQAVTDRAGASFAEREVDPHVV